MKCPTEFRPLIVSFGERFHLNVLLAIAFLLPPSQVPNPSITFETRATFADKALSELSKTAGVKLMVSPQTKDEILIIRVKDVPFNELLAKIAHAASAEWQKEATGYRLIRSAKLLQEQERKHAEIDAARIASAQKALQASLMEQGEMTPELARTLGMRLEAVIKDARDRRGRDLNYKVQQQIGRAMPGGRLAAGLALLLDSKTLAAMDDPGKLVFSTAPNRMQRPLPPGAHALIERYAREREMMKPHLPQVDASNLRGLSGDIWNVVNRSRAKDDRIAKVLVEARTWEFASNMMVTVYVANAAGRILEQSYCSLSMNEMMGQPPADIKQDPSKESPLELSQPAKELMQVFRAAMARGGGPEDFGELPASVKPYLLEPENHTLAELACTDLLLGAAKTKGLNLVAAPTDIFGFYSCMMFDEGVPTANQFLERMRAPIFDMKLEEPPGWLILRMEDPYSVRRFRMDRALLGKLLRDAVANQRISIDGLASFAVTTSEDFERLACLSYFMLACPKVGQDLAGASWQILRFHGGLSPVQRQALDAGEKIPYTRLRPDQQRIFHRMVFASEDNYGHTLRGFSAMPVASGGDEEEAGGEKLEWQPTERYPNGLGANSTISRRSGEGTIIRAKGIYRGQYSMDSNMTIDSIASYLVRRENPETAWADDITYNEFTVKSEKKFEYAFDGDPEFRVTGELRESQEISKPVNSLDRLPEEIWTKIKQQMAQLKEAMKNRKPPPAKSVYH